ncbi:1-acyl-sn-glycerol-3-phosphate acyltransferase [Paraglaciecola sp. 2405UD69-4]|uniref:1-acyl-sn-glycerol-3-phosphate acyltransferase n=1 Tax=Paraglaciecola sp. 2405UD69-4 TaxID=3391836 RepID=UPI0039C8FC5E
MPERFDSIRPFDDADLATVLPKLFNNAEFIASIVAFRFASWPDFLKPLLALFTRLYINMQAKRINTLSEFQSLIAPFMDKMIATTTESVTITGLETLDVSEPCLFISNHRDIALDPAFINWTLHENGQDTVRIAVGDNLLKKPWVADLIRLNKCFIVKRKATDRREKLQAAKLLSEYIEYTLHSEGQHVWIAQREGRAKDGNDLTNPAIISMLSMNKPKTKTFSEYINELRIVPVSISYEFDPCDVNKAKELHQLEKEGSYDKPDNEDVRSIVNGITGQKGRVHLHFSKQLVGEFENAKEVAASLDREILQSYQPFATGAMAASMLDGVDIAVTDEHSVKAEKYLKSRLEGLNEDEKLKLLSMYAAAYKKQLLH